MQNTRDIITFRYNGAIQESTTTSLMRSIVSQIEIANHIKFKAILISLKNASYGNDHQSLALFVKNMSIFSKKIGITIACIEYSIPLYQLLKKFTSRTNIKLFKNSDAAKIFLNPKLYKKGMQILIYDNDDENSSKLTKELTAYGYTVRIAKTKETYATLIKEEHYDVVVTQSTLNIQSDNAVKPKNVLNLSKKLIANLPVFMDTAVETLVSFTGLEALKSSHSITRFQVNLSSDIICAVMHFHGDIAGSFVLVFPKDIAIIAMEALFGESLDEHDMDALLDGVGEFCNTITGSTKTALSGRDIKVIFDLPKKYTSMDQTMKEIGDENGIWIDMQLAGKPFYMFITK